MNQLHATLNAERRARGLSWVDLAGEINKPFDGNPSIPISVATIRGILSKRSVTSAVVLQILCCLRRSPESFLIGGAAARSAEEMLPEPGPSRVLRLDTKALYAALDAERKMRGLTWEEVAGELPGFTVSMVKNLSTGPLIGFPRVMLLTQWLRCPLAKFVRDRSR
ncbi:MAG TPA: hypothetical protein VME45_00160 [Stellaceae bacterium]|nr:hypothetical protein [Stellaceae bacterium]